MSRKSCKGLWASSKLNALNFFLHTVACRITCLKPWGARVHGRAPRLHMRAFTCLRAWVRGCVPAGGRVSVRECVCVSVDVLRVA